MPSSAHGTLVASTVTLVTLTNVLAVEVLNKGTTDIFWNYGIGTPPADPTVGGSGMFCAAATPASAAPTPSTATIASQNSPTVYVKLISSSTPTFSVQGRSAQEAIPASL